MVLPAILVHPVAVLAAVVAAIGAILGAVTDSRIDPVGWNPPDPPEMSGTLEPNERLRGIDTVVTCEGPEDVAFDESGRMYTGVENGNVLRTREAVDDETTDAGTEVFARTDGRPLGMEFDGERLVVCAEDAGLLSVSPDGEVTALSTHADERRIRFADDLYVADDGTVYFTDATEHDIFQDELFELRDTGRLLGYDPETEETTVELEGLGFANGVCPCGDGESLLVTETSRYRVTRFWYDGERAGDSETFVENLPGYPDNIEAADDGTYWVAIPTPRDASFDNLQGRPWLKRQLGKLPKSIAEKVSGDPYGLVLRLDEDGEIIDSLHDPEGDVFGVTSATPHEGALYLGSLFGYRVTRYDVS